MKLVVCSTIPDILPYFKAESGSTRFKLLKLVITNVHWSGLAVTRLTVDGVTCRQTHNPNQLAWSECWHV